MLLDNVQGLALDLEQESGAVALVELEPEVPVDELAAEGALDGAGGLGRRWAGGRLRGGPKLARAELLPH